MHVTRCSRIAQFVKYTLTTNISVTTFLVVSEVQTLDLAYTALSLSTESSSRGHISVTTNQFVGIFSLKKNFVGRKNNIILF